MSRLHALATAAASAIGGKLGRARRRTERLAEGGRWQAIFDTSAVGIAVTDRHGYFTATNRAYREMVGYDEEELREMTFMDLTFEEDRPVNAALLSELHDGKRRQFDLEKRYRRKDGRLIWVRITVSEGMSRGNRPFGMAIVEDITVRKVAEERLREYEKVVENAQELIVVVDREYRHLIANRMFLDYSGLRREDVIGHRMGEFSRGPAIESVIGSRMDECFQGKLVQFEVNSPGDGRSARDLSVSLFPIEGTRGIDRVAAVMQDITDRKESNERLQRSLADLRALTNQLQEVREEERARLARELHDELGQALTAIRIDLAALPSAGADSLPARVQSMMRFVDGTIQSVRRISTELRPSILDDLGLVAAMEWAAEDFQRRTGIACQLRVPEHEPEVDAARTTALFRILQETLTNVARHAGAMHVKIILAEEDGDLKLWVEDDGHGISEERAAAAGSLGILGMRERARLAGGSLEIAGQAGRGTTVYVRIPRQEQKYVSK